MKIVFWLVVSLFSVITVLMADDSSLDFDGVNEEVTFVLHSVRLASGFNDFAVMG